MSTIRILKTLAVMAVMLTLAAVPAMAQSELDQSQTTIDESRFMWTDVYSSQTFTAQKTGRLEKVSIYIGCCLTTSPPGVAWVSELAELEVEGVQEVVHLPYYPDPYNPGDSTWVDVPLDPAPLVEAGEQYRIVLSRLHNWSEYAYYVGTSYSSDVYPGGRVEVSDDGVAWRLPTTNVGTNNLDMAFKTYVTTADSTSPKVDSVSPASGKTGVARGTNLEATFSEQMDPDTVNSSTFRLFKVNANGTTTRITNAPVILSADGLSAKLDPYGVTSTTRLAPNTRYKAAVTTGAKDVAGNALDQNAAASGNQQKAWFFTTGRT